jgi:hypothetical protein
MNKNRERERKGKKERMKGATKEERNRSKLHNMCIYIIAIILIFPLDIHHT